MASNLVAHRLEWIAAIHRVHLGGPLPSRCRGPVADEGRDLHGRKNERGEPGPVHRLVPHRTHSRQPREKPGMSVDWRMCGELRPNRLTPLSGSPVGAPLRDRSAAPRWRALTTADPPPQELEQRVTHRSYPLERWRISNCYGRDKPNFVTSHFSLC
jgi:hypothetical protein